MNMVICKVGVAAGTTGTGDIMIIPNTMVDSNLATANNPLPTAPMASATATTPTNWAALNTNVPPEAVPAILAGYGIA